MPTPPLPAIASLDPTVVAALQTELYQLLAEAYPQAELTRGFIHDVNLEFGAIVAALLRSVIDTVASSQSLLLINADPALANTAVVDQVLSNFNVTRLPGTPAVGAVTIVLDALVPITIPATATFTTGTSTFGVAQSYAVRISQRAVTGPTDLVLAPLGNGSYICVVPVAAAAAGVAGMLRRGAALTPGFTIPHFIAASATADFTGGFDVETNAALLARLQQGIAAPTFSSRANIDALVHQNPTFAQALQLSVIGAGDPEMLRDKHTIFPIAQFGRADAYLRTATLPQAVVLTKVAGLAAITPAGGVWQIVLARDDAPGFYEVTRVALPAAAASDPGFGVTLDLRGFDRADDVFAPDITTAIEAAYSRYATAVVQFLDTVTPTTGLTVGVATNTYNVSVAALPLIAAAQTFLGGRGVLAYGGDVVAKAPVPCFLRVAFEVRLPALAAPPVVAVLQAALAAAVNTAGFVGVLSASFLAGVLRDLIPAGAVLGPIDLFGRVRHADGTIVFLRDPLQVQLSAPYQPQLQTSARTLCYFLDPADVAVTLRVVAAPDI
jgi:hypothetical protein